MSGSILGYKVVRVGPDDQLLSATPCGPWDVTYEPDVLVEPRLGGLFAFVFLRDARAFTARTLRLGMAKAFEVWEAELDEAQLEGAMAAAPQYYERFWRGDLAPEFRFRAPPGTFLASAVRLLQRVRAQ